MCPLYRAGRECYRTEEEGGTSLNEVKGVAQLAKWSIRTMQSRFVWFGGLYVISHTPAINFVQGRATLVFTVSNQTTNK
jgi:hypothetical protein